MKLYLTEQDFMRFFFGGGGGGGKGGGHILPKKWENG